MTVAVRLGCVAEAIRCGQTSLTNLVASDSFTISPGRQNSISATLRIAASTASVPPVLRCPPRRPAGPLHSSPVAEARLAISFPQLPDPRND
ncbi:hypothetical protein TgHK011_001661 [Trichoderma gracile]|nr:hypothetical protein TgHK011_001661 [Trichoderma gracile]